LAFTYRAVIAKLALVHRLPLAVWSRVTLEAGALMSYGVDNLAITRRTAVYVDKILKGVRPSELPVEQPTKLQFLINLKTAKALDLNIPLFLQQRADEVIEQAAMSLIVLVFGRRQQGGSARSTDRRPKSAKARSRGKLGTGQAAGAKRI